MARVDPYGTLQDISLEPGPPRPLPAKATEAKPPAVKPPAQAPAARPASPAKAAKLLGVNAEAVCKRFPLSDEARPLLSADMALGAFLQVLRKQGHHLDAVRLLAHALPKREVVWWACACTRTVFPEPTPQAARALQSAEKWCADPSEANRRAAEAAAEAAALHTPAGCAAIAAFWSSGSLGPPNTPVVPPGETLTAQAAANAVLMAAVIVEPHKAAARYAQFLALGAALGEDGSLWNSKNPSPAAKTQAREASDDARGSRR